MTTMHTRSNCRWADQVVAPVPPMWAQSSVWVCTHDRVPREIGEAAECRICSFWEPRGDSEYTPPGTVAGRGTTGHFLDIFARCTPPADIDTETEDAS